MVSPGTISGTRPGIRTRGPSLDADALLFNGTAIMFNGTTILFTNA